MKVKVKAIDAVSDHRLGNLQAGQTGVMSEDGAKELESLNLVKIIGAAKDEDQPETKKTGIVTSRKVVDGKAEEEEKSLPGAPENKMGTSNKRARKAK